MASNEITVKIKVADIKQFEDLIVVLCQNIDDLPQDLYDAVMAVVDYDNEAAK